MRGGLCRLLLLLLSCAFCLSGAAANLRLEKLGAGARVLVDNTAGQEISISATPALGGRWEPIVTLTPSGNSAAWNDSAAALRQFYRLSDPAEQHGFAAPNFRLIDHKGFSRELEYHFSDPEVSAVVLIFVLGGVQDLASKAADLQSLQNAFAPKKARFWVIDVMGSEARDKMTAAMNALNLDWPVLQDRAGTICAAYGVERSRCAFVVDTQTGRVIYKGAVSGGDGTPFLQNALDAFYAQRLVSPSQVRADGPLSLMPELSPGYSRDVAPILLNRCVKCHSEGNIAPWSMTDYSVISSYARAIEKKVLSHEMPPWHADPQYGRFSNDSSLTPAEESTLLAWIREGAPRGGGPDPLAEFKPPLASEWPVELGKPDLIISIPEQSIPATGTINYRYIQVRNPLKTDAWLRAAVVKPGDRQVVHHANVSLGDVNRYLSIYVPGQLPAPFPEGTGRFLPADTNILFQMHYISIGEPRTDQTSIGLYFASQPPAHPLQTCVASANDISIPPGAREYLRDADYVLERKSILYELNAHMHYRGARMKFEAIYPDGTSEVLLSVPHYEFHWQTLYRLAELKTLPAGTRLHVSGAFDNSAQNRENPDPTRWVYNGEQTWDEMFIGFAHCAEVP